MFLLNISTKATLLSFLSISFSLLSAIPKVRGAVYESAQDLLEKGKEWDFIVVGGGIAGSVLANRLSSDGSTRVVLLEAGGSNLGIQETQIPLQNNLLPSPSYARYTWNYTTLPQVHAGNRTLGYVRGWLLGGSSSINGMVYTRGSRDNWNHYANLTGDEGWSWERVLPYFLRAEQFLPPANNLNESNEFNPSYHSTTGQTSISLPGFPTPIDARVEEAAKDPGLGDEFGWDEDYNDGLQGGIGGWLFVSLALAFLLPVALFFVLVLSPRVHSARRSSAKTEGGRAREGGREEEKEGNLKKRANNPKPGTLQFTIGHGERSSAATAYLSPEILSTRKNLDVLLGATVSRVLASSSSDKSQDDGGEGGGELVFGDVEFRDGASGDLITIHATKEIILSSGSIGSPHILLNSGIGPSDELEQLGIRTVKELGSVGKNLSDQPVVANVWVVNTTASLPSSSTSPSSGSSTSTFDEDGDNNNNGSWTWETFYANTTEQSLALEEWNQKRTGKLVDSGPTQIGFIRVAKNSSIWEEEGVVDPAPGEGTGHFELEISNGNPFPPAEGTTNPSTLVIASINLNPLSRGSITINSTNPFSPPLIDLNLLSSQTDISILRSSILSARRFVSSSAFSGYILDPNSDLGSGGVTSPEELDAYIRKSVNSGGHAVGSCSMSPRGKEWGVVDPDLKVKGVRGLRVVDASVLPSVPAGHTQAPVYAVAERAADLIKAEWGL